MALEEINNSKIIIFFIFKRYFRNLKNQ